MKIFEIAYSELLLENSDYNIHSTIDLFIDTTSINNKNGVENVEYGENKKKKISKISLICDEKKKAFSVSIHSGNTHDIKTVEKSIENLMSIKYRKINLIGDKGYISAELKNKYKEQKINMVYTMKKE